MKYILIYDIDEYPEMGGGLQVDFAETATILDEMVEKIMQEGHTLIAAGELNEYTYKTVEVIKKVVRE